MKGPDQIVSWKVATRDSMTRSPCEEELGAALSPHVKLHQGNLSAVGTPHLTPCSKLLYNCYILIVTFCTLPQAGVQG